MQRFWRRKSIWHGCTLPDYPVTVEMSHRNPYTLIHLANRSKHSFPKQTFAVLVWSVIERGEPTKWNDWFWKRISTAVWGLTWTTNAGKPVWQFVCQRVYVFYEPLLSTMWKYPRGSVLTYMLLCEYYAPRSVLSGCLCSLHFCQIFVRFSLSSWSQFWR